MKSLVKCLLSFVVLSVVGCAQEIQFNDPNLEAAIRGATGKSDGTITEDDLLGITELRLKNNQISDITPLSKLTNLTDLWLVDSQTSDLTPLSNLTNLTELGLRDNTISDIKSLVENKGLSEDGKVDLAGNPLNDAAYDVHIPALQKRGIKVNFDPRP